MLRQLRDTGQQIICRDRISAVAEALEFGTPEGFSLERLLDTVDRPTREVSHHERP